MRLLLCMTVPLCKTCIHYIPPIDGRFESSRSSCKKFSTIDVVHGEIEYSLARDVRQHSCGPEGTLYQPEPNVQMKEFRHNIKRNAFYLVCALLYASLFAYTQIK
jgi:hypothetical protein